MKILTALTFSFFAFGVLAQQNLSDMKRMANDSIGKEISTLESNKSCVNGAKTVEAFKACKYDLHENMNMQKEQDMMKSKKVNQIEEDSVMKKDEVMDKKADDLKTSY